MPSEAHYTYSSNPATDDLDAVRALISDVGRRSEWLLSDEEILFALSGEGNKFLAAATCAEMIAGQFTGPSRNITQKQVGDLKRVGGSRSGGADDWYELATKLRKRARRGAIPLAGGIDVDDRKVDRENTSQLQPDFVRGMDDFMGPVGDGLIIP